MSQLRSKQQDLRRLVDDLQRKSVRLSTLNDFALRLMTIPTTHELVWYVARQVVGRLGFDDCVIYLVDPERNILRQAAAIGSKNPHADVIVNVLEIPIGQGITGAVAKTMKPIIVDDLSRDSRYIFDVEEARSEICVPLIIDGTVVGVIDSEDPRLAFYDDDDLELLLTVAAMTSARMKIIDQAQRDEERREQLRQANARMTTEIEQRQRVEAKLREVQDLFVHTEGIAKLGHWEFDEIEERSLAASTEMARLHGVTAAEFLEQTGSLSGVLARVHPDDRDSYVAAHKDFRATPKRTELEHAMLRADGRILHVREIWEPVLDAEGALVRSVRVVQDISERKLAEEKLKESEARLKAAAEVAGLGHYTWDLIEDRCTFCSEEYARIHGMTVDEYMNDKPTLGEDLQWVHPDDRERYWQAVEESLEAKESLDIEYRIVGKDGVMRHVHEDETMHFDQNGNPCRSEGILQDITEIKEAEERLRQAQKMEAVGQLTGGVAHDFNNLLAVIQGHAELLAARKLDGVEKFTDTILRATKRGAELTQRLLAFSRQQPLRPQAVDLANLIAEVSELIVRTLGENIAVETRAARELWQALADPGQVENALLNLAINARDAMPNGGRLVIECKNARLSEDDVLQTPDALAGDYVMVAVSDTGSGMSRDVLEHAFEPFFTTKEVGQGSGLGLSMVYGFTKQSGGHVVIETEEGLGTSIKLYLPRSLQVLDNNAEPKSKGIPRGDGEIILVIEDDSDVRGLTVEVLEGLGYKVIAAPDAAAARDALTSGVSIDLVLSDVVLPGGTNGPQLVEEARLKRPDLKVIFMSGYPADAALQIGVLGRGKRLIDKPFRRRELARSLREMLEFG